MSSVLDIVNEKQNVEYFIRQVFNFYNGKINIFNKAILKIDWVGKYGCDVGGTTRNPNIVEIYPLVTYRYFKDSQYLFYYNLIVSIIHELHHVDQVICYPKLKNNPMYLQYIENSVDIETYIYIANHQQEILENFGFQDNNSYDTYRSMVNNLEMGRLYKRRNYLTHLISILQDIIYHECHPMLDKVIEVFYDTSSNLVLFINDLELLIKQGNDACPVEVLNSVFEDQFFKYSLREASTSFNYNSNNNVYELRIKSKGMNVLCNRRV